MYQRNGSIVTRRQRKYDRRSVALVWTAISMTVVVGFAALSIDVGHLMMVKGQMQVAADAAAMAGVSALANPDVPVLWEQEDWYRYLAMSRAYEYAAQNKAEGQPLSLWYDDIQIGQMPSDGGLDSEIMVGTTPYDAVRVNVRKDDVANSKVAMFFARFWGKESAKMTVSATAMLDRRMSGYRPVDGHKGPLMPVTVKEQRYLDDIESGMGNDNWSYDPHTGEITPGPDGIPELTIYPEMQKEADGSDGAGNFGILNVNSDNAGAAEVADQIRNGLTQADIMNEFGQEFVSFFNEGVNGPMQPAVMGVEGTPGLMANLKSAFDSRVGDVIGYFLHNDVTESGANNVYTLMDMQFGRLMYINLTGSPQDKMVVVQPAFYSGPEIMTSAGVPGHETAGRIRLVR